MAEYAIIKSGGKQYRVEKGDVIDVELLSGEQGAEVSFQEVLFLYDGDKIKVGSPALDDVIIRGEIVDSVRGPKVVAYKYKRRKNYRRKVGHRQHYTRVKITEFAGR
ncbi:MAG: 50S ribosomal protein L21 [Chlamydiales bacterium]